MGRLRKDALDLDFLPETSTVKFIGPKRISYFSTYFDEKHKEVYRFDKSSQRYLDVTKLDTPINCLEGFNPESDVCVLPIVWPYFMRWIGDNDEVIRGLTPQNNSQQSIDFICTNMELKIIMLSFYDERDWIIHAHKTKSGIVFYLTGDEDNIEDEDEDADEDISDNIESEPQYNPNNRLNYARFNVIRKITEAVEECEKSCNTEMDIFSTISFSRIGQHRILHYGFTEFVMSKDDVDKPINLTNFAALKLMRNLFKGRKPFNISFYRHMYWWASALVTGVERFICGDLDKDFNLRKLDVFPVSLLDTKFHATAQKKCLITLDKILLFIKTQVKEENKVYEFRLNAATNEVIVSPSRKPIEDHIPPWYRSDDIPDQEKS